MKIYTLTLNPAYDVHASTEHFQPYHENLAHVTSREAGGKGVNISRALTRGGTENTAVIVLGTDNAADFQQDLEKAGLNCLYLPMAGRIRENLTLHCAQTGETRISFSGFPVTEDVLTLVEDAMDVDEDTYITFTGRIPGGISVAAAKDFLSRLRKNGAKIVIDCKSFTLEDLFELKPWLIKPNQEEISEYFGKPVETPEQAAVLAQKLSEKGIENAMISLGEQGALLAHDGKVWQAVPPRIEAVSTIGAGDSSIAGFLAAAAKGAAPEECLKNAVAYGTAACLTPGTQPPRQEDIAVILQQIQCNNL